MRQNESNTDSLENQTTRGAEGEFPNSICSNDFPPSSQNTEILHSTNSMKEVELSLSPGNVFSGISSSGVDECNSIQISKPHFEENPRAAFTKRDNTTSQGYTDSLSPPVAKRPFSQ